MSRILRIKEVSAKVGLPRSSIYRLIPHGEFPHPIRLSEKAVGWRDSEIDEWIDRRAALTESLRAQAAA
jgi:prophage regulatory protein